MTFEDLKKLLTEKEQLKLKLEILNIQTAGQIDMLNNLIKEELKNNKDIKAE